MSSVEAVGLFSGSGESVSFLRSSKLSGDKSNVTWGEDELDFLQAILAELGLDVLNLLLQRLEGE